MKIRHAHGRDWPLIWDSWVESYRRTPQNRKRESQDYYPTQRERITDILAIPSTVVAVAVSDLDDDAIMGWICCDAARRIVHYMWTAKPLRRRGIAQQLLTWSRFSGSRGSIPVTHQTPAWQRFVAPDGVHHEPSSQPSAGGAPDVAE